MSRAAILYNRNENEMSFYNSFFFPYNWQIDILTEILSLTFFEMIKLLNYW